MAYRVPFVDAPTHYQRYKPQIDEAIIGCLTRGELVYRQELRDFEAHLADFVGTKYAVGLNSGYHALEFALRGAGVGPGDEVITVAHTFVATISAIVNCGATPVLVGRRLAHAVPADLLIESGHAGADVPWPPHPLADDEHAWILGHQLCDRFTNCLSVGNGTHGQESPTLGKNTWSRSSSSSGMKL